MELPALIAALSRPEAYPHPAPTVEVRQTHISVVFLAGPFAYKVKKPVQLAFLDFSTLDRRRHFCEEETRLNRRLAPGVYLGVCPITQDAEGVRLGGTGPVIEWAVQMQRLPEEASLHWQVRHEVATVAQFEELARRVAEFHRQAGANEHLAEFGRFEVVAANARDNFAQSARQVGTTVSPRVLDRLRHLTDRALDRLRPFIEARAARGVPRDTHGDLRLDHVYFFPDQAAPGHLAIIDCIEFNERFRYADPIADIAFLVMDLLAEGRRDLASIFAEAYFTASGDEEGRQLLPFYVAYRAAVRGKVEGLKQAESEVLPADRDSARTAAQGYWLLALEQLEEPLQRPALVLVGGLPGTGKSTLARTLADTARFEVIRSDVVRKELAGVAGPAASEPGDGIYSDAWTERTYTECLRRAEVALFEGRRVVVDATFRSERWRERFLAAAQAHGVPGLMLVCEAPPEVVRQRLEARTGDPSDADWSVYLTVAQTWEEPGPTTRRHLHTLSSLGPSHVLDILQPHGLA